jgi:MFS family permease
MENTSGPARLWNRNFTLLWQGQVISSIGKQTFALAAMLWMKHLTDSGTLVGLVMTAALLPMVVLGPVAGVMVDRWHRQRLIAWTDILGGLLVLLAALLFFLAPGRAGLLIGTVFAVTVLTGLLDAFSQPAIGASVPDLVPQERLEAANGLNMAGIQAAMFIAQGAAGYLFVRLGAAVLVLLNAVTYLCAGVSELFLRIPHRPRPPAEESHPWQRFRTELAEGLRFVLTQVGMRTALLLSMALNFLIAPVLVLLPFYVEDFLKLSPAWYGYLMAAFGFGSLLGFLLTGAFPPRGRAREAAVGGGLVLQSALIPLLLLAPRAGVQLAGFLLIGILNGVINVSFMTLLQLNTPPELLGRVQSLSMTVSAAVMPLGMALAGIVFDLIGQDVVLMFAVSGGLTLACSILGLASRSYRAFLRFVPAPADPGAVLPVDLGSTPANPGPIPADLERNPAGPEG